MSTLSELVKDLDPEALRLRMALEARGKAEARVEAAAKLLDDMQAAEAHARSIRDELLAELAHRLDAMGDDDDLERAQIALDFAAITDTYKPFAVALDRAEDNLADAKRALRSAVEEVAKYPIPTVEP
jgi:DNA repair exonuclease SbcCD ATPase subunit